MKRAFATFALLATGCAGAPRTTQGYLMLHVRPAEARVLLDERYIGSGAQLSGRLLRLIAGRRRLEVSAEGHYSVRREADVRVGAKAEVTIDLHAVPDGEVGN